MINFDDYTNEYNLKWLYISNYPYRILTIGGSGLGKTNALLNLIKNEPDIDKIYLYAIYLNLLIFIYIHMKQNINI